MEIPNKNKTKDKLYMKAKSRHSSMMGRCYREHSSGYKYYGAKGVTVCERWHSFENFYADLDKLEGWDEEKFISGEISLDKDYKVRGNKEYSPESCCFVSKEINNKLKPTQQKEIIAMSPKGNIYTFMNQSDFAKEHNLQLSSIHYCLTGKWKHTNQWQFKFKKDYNENSFKDPASLTRILVGLSPEGKLFEFTNATKFSKDNGLLEATVIYACANMKNTHTRGWQFRFKDELEDKPFKDKSELNIVGERNKLVKAIDPEGKVWYTTNRSKFAREHNLNRHEIKKVIDGKKEHTCGWVFSFE